MAAGNDPSKEDQIRAKQAISPAGLGDRSDKGQSRPGSEGDVPDAPPGDLEARYVDDEGPSQEPTENVPTRHPNRNPGDKTDSGKPAYS